MTDQVEALRMNLFLHLPRPRSLEETLKLVETRHDDETIRSIYYGIQLLALVIVFK